MKVAFSCTYLIDIEQTQELLKLKGPKDTRFWIMFVDALEEYTYLGGDVIARLEDPPEILYFLRQGSCHELHPPYQNLLLREFHAPAWFGEVSSLTGGQRCAAIHAKSQCIVLQMSARGIARLSKQYAPLLIVFRLFLLVSVHLHTV